MNRYQSPQIESKQMSDQPSTQSKQQKLQFSTQHKSQDKSNNNQDIYHLTASFGMADSQQGGFKNYYKAQREELFYKTSSEKNQDYPRQMMLIQDRYQKSEDLPQQEYPSINNTTQKQEEQQDLYNENNQNDQIQSHQYYNQNELHFKQQEYNEETLHHQQFQTLNGQSQQHSQQNWYQQQQQQQQEQHQQFQNDQQKPQKQYESKIHSYLQQMVDNTQIIQETENQISNYMSVQNRSQQYQTNNTEEQEVERAPILPSPEIQPTSSLTYSEIAFMKQKQHKISQERIKEGKQQKLLNEIAHFYRQLAENKKQLGNDNIQKGNRSSNTSPIPKSTSQSRLSQKQPINTSVERKSIIKINSKQSLSHSKSVTSIPKKENVVEEDNSSYNQTEEDVMPKSQQNNKNKTHSQSVQQFHGYTKSNTEQSQPEQKIEITQVKNKNINKTQESKNKKQINNHYSSLQLPKMSYHKSDIPLQMKEVTLKNKTQTNQNIEINIPLKQILDLNPIQLHQFETKMKRQDFNQQKIQLLTQYSNLEQNIKYSKENESNYLSSVDELFNQNKLNLDNFKINSILELQLINYISKKNTLEGIKEIIELSDSYETITQDILVVESSRKSKSSARTQSQQEKDQQTISVLKDMQMRYAQKIFFIYLNKVQINYKKQIVLQIDQFEQSRNKLRMQLAMSAIRHYSIIRSYKNKLQNITKREMEIKKMQNIFNVIKAKGGKYTYYKPFSLAIRDNHRRILVQNAFLSIFNNMKEKQSDKRKLILTQLIYQSHLITKSFLILKAFSNRKKCNTNSQAMTAKNISLQFTTELRQFLILSKQNKFQQSFKWKQNNTVQFNLQGQNISNITEQQNESHSLIYKPTKHHSNRQQNGKQIIPDNNIQILDDLNEQRIQQKDKYDSVQRNIFPKEIEEDFEVIDQSYDSKQFQKHFYCEEEFLTSARSLLETKRQITLNKLDKIKILANQDQSSFLQKNKDKVQEQNRENQDEDSYEKIFELQSDSKLNLVNIPKLPEQNQNIVVEKEIKQYYPDEVNNDQCDLSELEIPSSQCKSILMLEQHVKQIIRVLKKLSSKKDSFKHKTPIDLLLKKDSFFYSSDNEKTKNKFNSQINGKPHPLQHHQEMIKRIEEEEKKKISSYLFYHWKIVFLERTLAAEIQLLYSLKKSKSILMSFKTRYRSNNEICQLNQQIREEKMKQNVFREWFAISAENSHRNKEKLNFHLKKICFRRIKYMNAYRKIKLVADNFYATTLKKGVFSEWSRISNENTEIRQREKSSILKRYFKQWKTQINNNKFLRGFWKKILYTPDELLFEKYGNKKNLLRAILKNWRGIVIENENSMKQKLAFKSGVQHRNAVLKTKTFFSWFKCIKIKKGLTKLFQSQAFKSALSKRILLPWKQAVAHQKSAVNLFQHKIHLNILFKAFHTLKIKSLQTKVAKCYFLRRFFLSWKQEKEYRQEILPRNYRNKKLLKNSLTSMIYFQLIAVREKAKKEKSTSFFLYHIKKFMHNCLNLWQKYTFKRKSKVLLQGKLKKYAEKNIKRRAFTSLKLFRMMVHLQKRQQRKALDFRQQQYQKKYNLQTLMNDPKYYNQLQLILTILHSWRAYSAKEKNIKFIQSRFTKFQNRKTLANLFNHWQNLFEQKIQNNQQKIRDQENESVNRSINYQQFKKLPFERSQSNSILGSDKYNKIQENNLYKNIDSYRSIQNHQQSFNNHQNLNQEFDSKILKDKFNNKRNTSQQEIQNTFPSPQSNLDNQSTYRQNYQKEQKNNNQEQNIITNNNIQQRSSRSNSRSNSPNQHKSTLKQSVSQENLRKNRKSVRFAKEESNYPSIYKTHQLDYFDQKYNENEAFYQKLISHKRYHTSQE